MSSIFGSSFRQSFILMSAPAKLVLLAFLVLLFVLFGSLAAFLIAVSVFPYDLNTLYQIIQNPSFNHIGVIKFFQIFQSITLFIIPALIAAWLFSSNPVHYLNAGRPISGISMMLAILSLFTAIPMLNAITELNARMDLPVWLDGLEKRLQAMEQSAAKLTELFLVSNSSADLLVNILMIAILPAIGEEFLFRGVIQRLFTEWTGRNHAGIIISAFLFSFIHFQFFGFFPRFLLGLYFGYLLFWTRSIWIPVAAHFLNNGIAVVYYHFAGLHGNENTLDSVGTDPNANYFLYISVFVTSILIGMIYLNEKGRNASI